MGAQTQTNETLTQNFIRAYTQRGGPSPANIVRYAGYDEQYLMVGDVARPDRGAITPIEVNDPQVRGLFARTGIQIAAPDIPSASLTFKQRFGGVPWYKFRLNCPLNVYEVEGLCEQPDDPLNGWSTMQILSRGLSSNKTYAGRTPFDGSDESTTAIDFAWLGDAYTIGGLALGEKASVDVTTEVIDGVYYGPVRCTDCGPANDGASWIALLQQTAGGSSAVVGKVLYSTDGGATWTASAITGLGVGVLVTAIDVVGQYMVVVAKTENAYYVSPINQLTGALGTWTKITTGFVAAKTPNDMYVESPSRIYFVGDGGYIYVSTNILSGVSVLDAGSATAQNLNRIHGKAGTLLAVGASNASVKSTNRGVTWAQTAGSVTGTLQAPCVISPYEYYLGTAAGAVYYTLDAGATWTQLTLTGAAVTAIQDIVAPTDECLFVAATRAGPTAAIFQTTFGGALWAENNTSRLPGTLPVFGRANRLAFPRVADLMVAANNLAAFGLGGGLVDGIAYLAQAPIY